MWQLCVLFLNYELQFLSPIFNPNFKLKMSLNLFPKAVFLIVLLSYLKATEEFKATHSDPHPPPTVEHSNSFKQRFKERFRRSQSQPAVWEKVPEDQLTRTNKEWMDLKIEQRNEWHIKDYQILKTEYLSSYPSFFSTNFFKDFVKMIKDGMNAVILAGFNPI